MGIRMLGGSLASPLLTFDSVARLSCITVSSTITDLIRKIIAKSEEPGTLLFLLKSGQYIQLHKLKVQF
ncbi:hypothetical protein Tsubulata_018198 [Turnera subulata]|uniref:Uncharacterized protein n=1 Tax=Turnera subulata TaxID=218843 RepID=A0A9Q0F8R4_9ROSI|nr:hypothetical protein Tsubulata_018198 [Turnera subulata]